MGGPLHRLPADRRARRDERRVDAPAAGRDRRRSGPRPRCSRASRCGRRSCRSGAPGRARFLKAESLQPIGAFKIRGAYVAVASLPPDERARGVITYSSGNHAQGVARAARLLGAPAVVVMPSDAPAIKRARVEADGAEIVVVGTASDERQRGRRADRRGARPRDHPAVRRRPDHRRPGHGRARDRRGAAGRRRRPRPDRRRRAGERGRGRGPGARAGRAGDRRRAGAGRRRAGVARGRPDRPLGGRPTCRGRSPTGRGRQALGGRTFAHLSALLDGDRDGHRGRDRGGGPARGRGEPARRRAVGRAERRRAGVPGAPRSASTDSTAPVVAVVSGGNVDPERYRAFLEAPIPPGRLEPLP